MSLSCQPARGPCLKASNQRECRKRRGSAKIALKKKQRFLPESARECPQLVRRVGRSGRPRLLCGEQEACSGALVARPLRGSSQRAGVSLPPRAPLPRPALSSWLRFRQNPDAIPRFWGPFLHRSKAYLRVLTISTINLTRFHHWTRAPADRRPGMRQE